MDEQRHSADLTRREALQHLLVGAAGLVLTRRPPALAASPAKPRHAKSVIQIWMWGGPSHLDTFDPKPDAGTEYCGPLGKPIPTNVPGIQIGELLPQLAKQADKYAILRSMTHGINAHETASYLMQTGRQPGRIVYPSAGAVVSYFKGYANGYEGLVPPYIVLTEPQGRFSEAGFLGQRFKPFATGGDPNQARFAVEGIVAPGISDERQLRRRELLRALDTLGGAMPGSPTFAEFDRTEERAYELMFGDIRKLFDLAEEDDDLRDRYGRHTFGQSCLMARRLVEAGVPYITINYKGWDTHKEHFQAMRRKLPEMDQGLATLLQDLTDRGLLDQTIIWWGGEFGRTPRVLWDPPWNGGRGHYGRCFSAIVAGGGFQGGQVVGASDARGEDVADRPIYPQDLLGSIYELLGIDPDDSLLESQGQRFRVLPGTEEGSPSGGRLREIMRS